MSFSLGTIRLNSVGTFKVSTQLFKTLTCGQEVRKTVLAELSNYFPRVTVTEDFVLKSACLVGDRIIYKLPYTGNVLHQSNADLQILCSSLHSLLSHLPSLPTPPSSSFFFPSFPFSFSSFLPLLLNLCSSVKGNQCVSLNH